MKAIPFGTGPDGTTARLHVLENARGFRAEISDFGATLVRLLAPDRDGQLADVVLGFDDAGAYAAQPFFIGGTIGRYGNRIARGRFELDGIVHHLSLNDGPTHARGQLHGGRIGFHHRPWRARAGAGSGGRTLRLTLRSADGDEGYPGNLEVEVAFAIPAERNELRIDFTAATDRATPFNPTHHAYFNLRGEGNVLDHRLQIDATAFLPVDGALIPSGRSDPVEGTPFDFRTPRALGERLAEPHPQLKVAGGYDHNYVLTSGGRALARAATVRDPDSGRVLQVSTTEPGLQLYSGNFLDGSRRGKAGLAYGQHAGFCLEAQHFPDSPNQAAFPSTILRPGEVFRSTTVYRLGTDRDPGFVP